ncbi:sulfotransferase family cytosolic 1B member 1-like [Acanthaster planci]|uniref:Sulfotransferase family cytosolic 1B member 1-like n=1 Tax=Acanthaster planci TaxID=133434 RepID=A0A8B7XRP3_ACAPL|nr:sulfotransferase family cytosolic 1B member 1-like [Acanthaster planci]
MSLTEQIEAISSTLFDGKSHQQLLEEWENIEKRTGCHVWNGVTFGFFVPQSNLEALKSFEVRDDDVFIFTYPRSGTHWVSEIVHYILNDGKGDFDRSFMANVLETTLAEDPIRMQSTTPGHMVCAAMKSPRCIISHCMERFRPPQVLTKNAKVVYVARNPKDVLVSWSKIVSFWRFDNVFWAFCNGRMMFGSWFDHVLGYWTQRGNKNVLFLKYEDIHKDLRGSICKLAQFVGKDLSDDVIDGILEHVTFDGMQTTYRRIEDEYGEEGKRMTRYQGTAYLRKGRVGDWKNYFTVAQNAIFDEIYAQRMKGTGLEFDFEL